MSRRISYFDDVREFLAEKASADGAIPEGVVMKEGNSVLRIPSTVLEDEGTTVDEATESFRLMHVPFMTGCQVSRGDQVPGYSVVAKKGGESLQVTSGCEIMQVLPVNLMQIFL